LIRVVKIAFSGAHSTGKTTTFNVVKKYLENENVPVYTIREVARSCPFPLNRAATPEGQRWIFFKQAMLEEEAAGKIYQSGKSGIILLDRCLLDCLVYSIVTKGNYESRHKTEFHDHMLSILDKITFTWDYSIIYLSLVDPNIPIEDDGRRDTDVRFREKINQQFIEFYTYRKKMYRSSIGYDLNQDWLDIELFKDISQPLDYIKRCVENIKKAEAL
jgi:thymidylate kinase